MRGWRRKNLVLAKLKELCLSKLTKIISCLVIYAAGGLAAYYFGHSPVEYISDSLPEFSLKDQHGVLHNLKDYAQKKGLIFISYNVDCHVMNSSLNVIREAMQKVKDSELEFVGIDPNIQDSAEKILAANVEFPVLIDHDQKVSKGLGFTRSAEIAAIDPQTWRSIYLGPAAELKDSMTKPSVVYVGDVIEALLQKKKLNVPKSSSLGCAIYFVKTGPP